MTVELAVCARHGVPLVLWESRSPPPQRGPLWAELHGNVVRESARRRGRRTERHRPLARRKGKGGPLSKRGGEEGKGHVSKSSRVAMSPVLDSHLYAPREDSERDLNCSLSLTRHKRSD